MGFSKVSLVAIIAALCVASNYAMVGVYNVKIMDFLVFVSGFVFGPWVGAMTGLLSWTVYGVLSPFGFSMPLWIATMSAETLYGLAGAAMSRGLSSTNFRRYQPELMVSFATIGFLVTLAYDLSTNIVYWATFENNLSLTVTLVKGVPFALIHELSNMAIFFAFSVITMTTLEKSFGGTRFGIHKK